MTNYLKAAFLHKASLKSALSDKDKYSTLGIVFFATLILPLLVYSLLAVDLREGTTTAGEIYGIIIFFQIFISLGCYANSASAGSTRSEWQSLSPVAMFLSLIRMRVFSLESIPFIISLLICSILIASNMILFLLVLLFSLVLFLQVTILIQLLFLILDRFGPQTKLFLRTVFFPISLIVCAALVYITIKMNSPFNLPLLSGNFQLIDPRIFVWPGFPLAIYLATLLVLLTVIAAETALGMAFIKSERSKR